MPIPSWLFLVLLERLPDFVLSFFQLFVHLIILFFIVLLEISGEAHIEIEVGNEIRRFGQRIPFLQDIIACTSVVRRVEHDAVQVVLRGKEFPAGKLEQGRAAGAILYPVYQRDHLFEGFFIGCVPVISLHLRQGFGIMRLVGRHA